MTRLGRILAALCVAVPCATTARATPVVFDAAGDPFDRSAKFRLDVDLPVFRVDATTLGAGYRQRSIWDVDNDDDPFRVESNFRPEVYLRHETGRWAWQGSYVHESNGLEQILSRGWNRMVARVDRRVGEAVAHVAVWAGFRVEDTNPDLRRTVGDGEIGWRGGPARPVAYDVRVRFTADPLDASPVASVRVAARVRAPEWSVLVAPVELLVEGFWGRGEMLQRNAEITRALRLGVAMGY